MKKIIIGLILLALIFCSACISKPKIKAPPKPKRPKQHRVYVVNRTTYNIIYVFICPRPVSQNFLYKTLVLHPQWLSKKYKRYKFYISNETIFLPEGNYYVFYVVKDMRTHKVLQSTRLDISVSGEGELIFKDIIKQEATKNGKNSSNNKT